MRKRILIVLVVVVVALVVGGGIWYIIRNRNFLPNNQVGENVNTQEPLSTNDQSTDSSETSQVLNTATGSAAGSSEFRSAALGISFNYLQNSQGQEIKIAERESKVFVYESSKKPEEGQFVEVFSKEANQSVEDAIKARFLQGRSERDCWIVETTANYPRYPQNYKIVEITYPKITAENAPWWELGDKCSPDYAQTNGIRYFLSDPNMPTKFVFFNIGQYALPAGANSSWQDTFKFTN